MVVRTGIPDYDEAAAAASGTVYGGVADKETVLTEPGLIVYRFDAPLVFANAAFFTERLEALIANAGAGLKCKWLFTCHDECPKNRVLKTPDGESGLNWLCAGLKAFFAHTERPMREMADLLKSGRYADEIMIRKPEGALATPR